MFLIRTIPDVGDLLSPLEQAIRCRFIPALTGQTAVNDLERDLFALPARLGGLGIFNPTQLTDFQHSTSKNVSAPLVSLILEQSTISLTTCKESQKKAKTTAKKFRRQHEKTCATNLLSKLPSGLQRAVEVASEKGASSWLSALPVAEHGFTLHKGAFRDALCLRYGWRPALLLNMP